MPSEPKSKSQLRRLAIQKAPLTVDEAYEEITYKVIVAIKKGRWVGTDLRAILKAVRRGGRRGPIPESFRILALHSLDCEVCSTHGTDNCDENERLCKVNANAVEAEYPT